MKTTSFSWAAFALIAVAAACNPGDKAGGTTTTGTTTGTTTAGTTGTSAPVVDAKLMNDGYRYMGFNRTGDMTYSYSRVEGTKGESGVESVQIVDATPDKATIKVNRSGALSDLGSESYEVRPDGVYLTEMALGQLEKPMLAIPGDVKVGSKWTSDLVTKGVGSGPNKFTIDNVAEKEEDITVKAGTYKALLVSGRGTMTAKGVTQTVLYKTWYTKDIGTVLMRIEVVDKKGTSLKSSVELTTAGKP
jgi:hypothetical protein